MYRLFYIFFILSTLAIISACDDRVVKPNTEDPFSSLPADEVIGPFYPIDSKVIFSLTEEIQRTGRNVSFQFHTERMYGLAGYHIFSSLSKTGNCISIQLNGILASQIGATILMPATASVDLGALPNDIYTMNFKINGVTIAAIMLVSDTSFVTKIQPNNLIEIATPRVLRVPRNIIWGQAESISPSVYQSFLDSLVFLGATPATLMAGQYHYFSINEDGSFSIPSMLGFPYGCHFLYRFDPDTMVSRSLVKRFAKRYRDSICVELLGGRGENYYTSVLQNEP